jgi:adenosylcobinamide kinase/adenosylcobinamide-phosphate guanylyltransferase
MAKLTFILGGARSGKSSHAQRLAAQHAGLVLYVATAQALDDEMSARIRVHRDERPPQWQTLEAPLGVGPAVQSLLPPPGLVLLDCLTMLVTNVLLQAAPDPNAPDEAAASAALEQEMSALLSAVTAGSADWIIVSNEVGLGLVPPYPLGRLYRDLLGWANQRLAARANEVLWMVAGIPVPIQQFR